MSPSLRGQFGRTGTSYLTKETGAQWEYTANRQHVHEGRGWQDTNCAGSSTTRCISNRLGRHHCSECPKQCPCCRCRTATYMLPQNHMMSKLGPGSWGWLHPKTGTYPRYHYGNTDNQEYYHRTAVFSWRGRRFGSGYSLSSSWTGG